MQLPGTCWPQMPGNYPKMSRTFKWCCSCVPHGVINFLYALRWVSGSQQYGSCPPSQPPVGLSQCWRALRSLEGCAREILFFYFHVLFIVCIVHSIAVARSISWLGAQQAGVTAGCVTEQGDQSTPRFQAEPKAMKRHVEKEAWPDASAFSPVREVLHSC